MEDLKHYFDRVVLVNLKRRPDRLAHVKALLTEINWPFRQPEIFEAVDGSLVPSPEGWQSGSGAWGCMRSHQHILERALTDKLERILILEDDICFVDDFRNKVERFLQAVPEDWDQLMLGGQHVNWNGLPTLVKPGIYRCLGCERTHCYALSNRFMRKLYRRWLSGGQFNGEVHCDWIMGRDPDMQASHKVFAPVPFLVGQEQGHSDIRHSRQIRKFWNAPSPYLPVIHLQAPVSVVQQLRQYGFHIGYRLDKKSGHDVGLVKIFETPCSAENLQKKLERWIHELQWEVTSDPFLICTIWHDSASVELVQSATEGPVIQIHADSVEEALGQLPPELRRTRRLPIAQSWMIYLDASRKVMDELRAFGWHNGFVRDDRTGLGVALMDLYLEEPSSARHERLAEIISDLQAEATTLPNGVAVIWHPRLSAQEVRESVNCKLAEITASSTPEALDQWHSFLKNAYSAKQSNAASLK